MLPTHMLRLVALLAVSCLVVACSDPDHDNDQTPNGTTPDAGHADADPDADTNEGNGDVDPEAPSEDLSGTWAQLMNISAFSDVPVVGEVQNETISIQKLRIEQNGLDLEITAETCSIILESTPALAETIIPDAFVESLEVTTRPGTLTVSDDGVEVYFPTFVEVRGAVLDDPVQDPLPTDPDDPRVFDQDGDGNPGLTVRVTGLLSGEIYVVQRGSDELTGQVQGRDRFDGLVTWENEQVVLGTDNPLLDNEPDTIVNPDPAASFFRTTRVADDAECPDLIENADTLFAR